MRVAIVHYWLVADRGGERVVRALCDMFPEAVIYTHVADRRVTDELFPSHEIRETFISRLPFAKSKYQSYLPLMPLALEQLDMTEFDLVISSESGPAKGIIPHPEALHVCYCHSPMRYLWDHYHRYRNGASWPVRQVMPFIAHRMRQWDVTSAARVDRFVANSAFVAARIKKYYRREAQIVHPPVDIAAFARQTGGLSRGDDPAFAGRYLWVGQLTGYKRPDIAIAAFDGGERKLAVIGEGELENSLKKSAGANVTFHGRADRETLQRAYASCRALVFPGVEDFGIVPVEAMAAGLPVIALGRGGALSTVLDGETGILFAEESIGGLKNAIERFELSEAMFDSGQISAHAQNFSEEVFKNAMRAVFIDAGLAPGALKLAPAPTKTAKQPVVAQTNQ